jgi:hypothetical protein
VTGLDSSITSITERKKLKIIFQSTLKPKIMKQKLNIAKNMMIGIVFLTFIISCNNAKNGWEKASQENSIVAYEAFLSNYNDSTYFE